MIQFADPFFFLFLVLLIPLYWMKRDTGGSVKYSNIEFFLRLKSRPHFHPRSILTFLRYMAVALFIAALARPQAGKVFSETLSEGVDILLALDTSPSMKALDFRLENEPTPRLTVVKKVVAEFIKKRSQDRMGLIVFGSEAFVQCPLTLDHGILLEFLKEVQIGMAGEMTAIGSAIGVGVQRIKDINAKSKVMILLTDGSSNSGRLQPSKAAEIARSYGIKVYTIGVGTQGKAPFAVDTLFGKQYQYMDVEIDEKTLKKIATTTEAQYFRAKDEKQLEQIYKSIDALETTEKKVKQYTEYTEAFHWFLLPGILLVIVEIVLGQTIFRKIP